MTSKKRFSIDPELIKKENVSAEKKAQCLQTALYDCTKEQPFLGSVLQCLNISYNHMLPTAGVNFNNNVKRWDMYINPHFFCHKLNQRQRAAVLLHEINHITNKHPFRVPFLALSPRKRMIMNIAADMAINQFIRDLPEGCPQCPPPDTKQSCENPDCPGGCIRVEDYKHKKDDGTEIPFKTNMTMEHYYEELIKLFDDPDNNDEENQDGNAGGGAQCDDLPETLDTHDWDCSSEEADMLEATEDLVKRAMIKQRLSYDDLPGHIKELLDDIDARKAELNYKALILSAIKRSATGHARISTWNRKSRRYGFKAPGTKVGDLPKLHMFIDTSGSISIEEANEFLDIVDNFLKAGSRKCRLNLFHTENYYAEEYKLGHRLERDQVQSGGTDLQHSMREIAKRRPDLAVFLTDGYYGDVEVEQMIGPNDKFPQCLFIISREGAKDHPLKRLGTTIQIPGKMPND